MINKKFFFNIWCYKKKKINWIFLVNSNEEGESDDYVKFKLLVKRRYIRGIKYGNVEIEEEV